MRTWPSGGVMDAHLNAIIPKVGEGYRGSDGHTYVRTAGLPVHSAECSCHEPVVPVTCGVPVAYDNGTGTCRARLRADGTCPRAFHHG